MNYWVLSFSKENVAPNIESLQINEIGLVFWASVKSNLEPSPVLKERLNVAYEAYKKGKIEKIIVSWDNSEKYYNEPVAMEQYLIKLWVDTSDIYLDYAWFDTFDSIYRAKHVFWVTKVTLFTQDFHLKRAMYISKRLWLETYGVSTNLENGYSVTREILARVKAFFDIEINNSKPKVLWPLVDMSKPQIIE